jgi:hypothetical protein
MLTGDDEYLNFFWECVAHLLDYFADFLVADNAMNQSLWFHLLDELKEAAEALPHRYWLHQVGQCEHSMQFARDYEQTLEVFEAVITAQELEPSKALVHLSRMDRNLWGSHVGDFKTGLKPWQQFLYNESPGFGVPADERVPRSAQDAQGVEDAAGHSTSERAIPMALLIIIQKHTERARALVVKAVQVSTVSALWRSTYTNQTSQDQMALRKQTCLQALTDMYVSIHFSNMLTDIFQSLDLEHPFTYTSSDGRDISVQQVVQPIHFQGGANLTRCTQLHNSAWHPHGILARAIHQL